jgi:prenyltransferase beta subunit
LALVACGWLVVTPAFAQTGDEKQAAVRYLQKHQAPTGGFAADQSAATKPTLRATSGAVRAIQYLGGEVPNRDAAAKFVLTCYDPANGGFADAPGGKPDVALTAVGLMAVVALKAPFEDTDKALGYLAANAKNFEEMRIAAAGLEATGKSHPAAKDWLAAVAKMQNADGTFGTSDQPRTTGGAAAMVLRLGGTLAQKEKVLFALKAGQQADGAFAKEGAKGSELEATYRIMRAFHLLKEQPKDAAALRAFVGKCRNPDGGYGGAPGQPSSVGTTYYAAVITKWLDGK